jgi:HK97 gp10 family phage protein
MAQDSTIEGGRQLDDLLKSLAPKMEKNILRTALRAGGNILRDEARSLVPRKSGDLAKTIRVSTRIRKGQVTASVKAGNRIAYYAHMVEFGTRAHIEKAPKGSAMAVNGAARKEVEHPGAQAKPFLRPAADNKFPEAIEAITAKIRERLTQEGLNTAPPLPPDETTGAA